MSSIRNVPSELLEQWRRMLTVVVASDNFAEVARTIVAWAMQPPPLVHAETYIHAMLRAARCPDPNCDNNGTSFSVRYGRGGEPEQEPYQCEWCFYRKQVLSLPTPTDNFGLIRAEYASVQLHDPVTVPWAAVFAGVQAIDALIFTKEQWLKEGDPIMVQALAQEERRWIALLGVWRAQLAAADPTPAPEPQWLDIPDFLRRHKDDPKP